eukprot:626692-Prymnesium_polylepis.2
MLRRLERLSCAKTGDIEPERRNVELEWPCSGAAGSVAFAPRRRRRLVDLWLRKHEAHHDGDRTAEADGS